MRPGTWLLVAAFAGGCGGAPAPAPPTIAPVVEAAPPPAPPAKKELTPAEKVDAIAAAYWEELLRHSPTWRTYLGDRSHDAELDDISPEERLRHRTVLSGLEAGLKRVDQEALAPRARLVAEVLQEAIARRLDRAVCAPWRWQVDQLGGPQVELPELPAYHTVETEARARDLVARYTAAEGYLKQHVENLREGLAAGYVAPRVNVERVVAQLEAQLEKPPAESAYVALVSKQQPEPPYAAFPEELLAAVRDHVYPGLRAYLEFLKGELLPKAREVPGVHAMPHGDACYAAQIRVHTGLQLGPDEIHQIGLDEVKRVRREMKKLARGLGYKNVDDALSGLAKRPDQHLQTRKALLRYNRKLLDRARAALPKAFGRLPKTPVELRPIEGFREKDAPAAYYYSAPEDGSRPAYYYLNTHQPRTRLLYKMPALAYHEALPGHHLQIALANENTELPDFMRHTGQTAFVEGWGLYAERLADELGLYEGPEEKLGALTYDIWRAARLVVDTGLHAKGWSRQQAIDYLAKHTGHAMGEVVNEIDRYIIWPGQALAYKLGQLEISKLRRDVKKAQGKAFDLEAFHDALLETGGVPLPVMRRHVLRALGVAEPAKGR